MEEPQAAVALVHARGPEESVLLILRAEREDDPWSGHWSFPGGRSEPEDSDLSQTALRELAEECGIQLGPEHLKDTFTPMLAGRRVGRFLVVAPFLFQVDGEMPTVLDVREAVKAVWLPIRAVADPTRHHLRSVPGIPPDMLFPCIEVEGVPLWGFTYRVLNHWLGIARTRDTGFEAAQELLALLMDYGLSIEHTWEDRPTKTAQVRGLIPVERVVQELAQRGHRIAELFALEIRPGRIRVVGLANDEYIINASA